MGSKRKLELIVLGFCIVLGLAWALITTDLQRFEFKLDYLISLSSLLTVASFSVKAMLPLRILAVASQAIAIPYFMLQPTPLWTPVGWTLLFMVINLYHILRILLERRPVHFSADEQRLYDLAFKRFKPREFLKLLKLGEWQTARSGTSILECGKPIQQILVPISGVVVASQNDKAVARLYPGEVIGSGIALTGQASPINAEFSEDSLYMTWHISDINGFMDKNPDLAIKFNDIVNQYLVAQINKLSLSLVSETG